MTYVASPRFSEDGAERKENLQKCLDVARKHLDETLRSSDAEKNAILTASAIAAGWSEDEVSVHLEHSDDLAPMADAEKTHETHHIGIIPSSSI